jgi:hypothetical protein
VSDIGVPVTSSDSNSIVHSLLNSPSEPNNMVDVFEVDAVKIIISGGNIANIDCRHLIPRSDLSPCTAKDSSSIKEASEHARKHGEEVLKIAQQEVARKYCDSARFALAGQSADRAGQGLAFDQIFLDADSLLLLQLGNSATLRQGSVKRSAALHLKLLDNNAGERNTQRPRKASTAPELPVTLPCQLFEPGVQQIHEYSVRCGYKGAVHNNPWRTPAVLLNPASRNSVAEPHSEYTLAT